MRTDGTGLTGRRLLIISILFILVVGGIFFAFTSGSRRGAQREPEPIEVTDVLASRSVRMTVVGPVEANEEHESYRIEVGIDGRNLEAIKGYDLSIVGSQEYPNNRRAYIDFVHALKGAGFDNERRATEQEADERGACPTGKRYIFEVLDDGRSIRRLWTSSCPKARGTLNGKGTTLKQLFDKQIPDLRTQLKPLSLR